MYDAITIPGIIENLIVWGAVIVGGVIVSLLYCGDDEEQ